MRFQTNQDFGWRLNDELLEGMSGPLKADASGDPDFLYLDDLRLGVIERTDQLAIRIWDPHHPVRQTFTGRRWFEPNGAFRIPAKIIPYDPPKAVIVADFVGIQRSGQMDARICHPGRHF